jgi:hypothetical protein
VMFSYRRGALGEAAELNIFYILGSAACHMFDESILMFLQSIDSTTVRVSDA